MKPSERLFSPPTTDKSSESTPQPEADGNEEGGEEEAAKLLPSHNHDEEGEGEEDEETTHVVRCKVYRLSKSEDKSEWKDLGVGSSFPSWPKLALMYKPLPTGMFRLKKHKETHVRRVLMRNSNTGRILIVSIWCSSLFSFLIVFLTELPDICEPEACCGKDFYLAHRI